MAASKSKEAIMLAIDIGKDSSQLDSGGKTYFEQSLFCASMILKRKLFSESKDDIGLILFGSSQTNNPYSSEGSFFKNIEIVSSLGVVTWDLLRHISNISSTEIKPSDWLSTLVVAADIIKRKNDKKIFTDLQIVMFSNFSTDISFDNIEIITRSINNLQIKLTMIGKDFEDISHNPMLEKFIMETKATAVDFESVMPQLSFCKPREVTPRPWKVPLSFGNIFSIKVSGFKKVDENTNKFKWFSCKSCDTPDSITELIKQTSYYYIENDIKKMVNGDDIIDGFNFGDTIIPVSDLVKDACGYKSGPKSLQVLGFTKAKNIQRSFLMDGGAYVFKPDESDFVAFGAIFKAMVEREEIMIVRKVYQMNCMPNIGAMFPQSEDDENYFVFVNLPFAEDEHLYKLPSLKSLKPNYEQKKAVRDLISVMDLDTDENESFIPENTYNPELQYLYHSIAQKAINPDNLLTKTIPEHIQSLLCPPERILEEAKQSITDIERLFSLSKASKKNLIKDIAFKIENVEEEEEIEIKEPCVISAYSPVDDFNKLLESGMNSERVCQSMKKLTVELIEGSSSLEELKKVSSNLKALRQFYIHNKNVSSYNNYMFHVKDSVLLSGKEEMWTQFIDSGIGLITNQEVDTSDITYEKSQEFLKHEAQEDDDVVADFIINDDDPLKEFLY